jgi:hypothetical protein
MPPRKYIIAENYASDRGVDVEEEIDETSEDSEKKRKTAM